MPAEGRALAQNRKARHEYHLEERYECGIALLGTEVKSLREGRAQLQEAYARMKDGELWLEGCHISPYEQGNRENHEPTRPRKLLLHRRELRRLEGKTREKGYTLVPLRFYMKGNRIKIEIALARGKRQYDKRESLKRAMQDREARAHLKERSRD
jgi:SsrA-binding protein